MPLRTESHVDSYCLQSGHGGIESALPLFLSGAENNGFWSLKKTAIFFKNEGGGRSKVKGGGRSFGTPCILFMCMMLSYLKENIITQPRCKRHLKYVHILQIENE